MSSWENCSHLLRIGHGHARCGVPATHFYRFKNPRTASKTIMYAKPPPPFETVTIVGRCEGHKYSSLRDREIELTREEAIVSEVHDL